MTPSSNRLRLNQRQRHLFLSRHAHASNALFVTNQSRPPHGHRVQPADTGLHSGRLGNPSQLYQGPHLP